MTFFVNHENAGTYSCYQSTIEPCLGQSCMAWRWRPLKCGTAWTAAVKKAAVELEDKSPSKTKAAAHVNANRAKYGLPTEPFEGWCGLAGEPVTK